MLFVTYVDLLHIINEQSHSECGYITKSYCRPVSENRHWRQVVL